MQNLFAKILVNELQGPLTIENIRYIESNLNLSEEQAINLGYTIIRNDLPQYEPQFGNKWSNKLEIDDKGIPYIRYYEEEDRSEQATITASNEMYTKRNILLKNTVDTMNPMRWETLSDIQKTAWRDYRQALLDVPQQEGFPWNINWPVEPNN